KSLFDRKILSLHIAQLSKTAAENLQVGAPRPGAADLQPADARNPGGPLRGGGRGGEQTYGDGEGRGADSPARPFHRHRSALRSNLISMLAAPREWLDYSTPKGSRYPRWVMSGRASGCETATDVRSASLDNNRIRTSQ